MPDAGEMHPTTFLRAPSLKRDQKEVRSPAATSELLWTYYLSHGLLIWAYYHDTVVKWLPRLNWAALKHSPSKYITATCAIKVALYRFYYVKINA